MQNTIRNFRWEVIDGKTHIYMHNTPQFILDINNEWLDLEVEYAEVKDLVDQPISKEDIDPALHTKYNEYMDIYNNYYMSGELPDAIIETTDTSVLDAWNRTNNIKQVEESHDIKYPRECIWVDGAPDIPGTIILPHDDYDKVYTINDDNTIEYLDEYTEGMTRPYYIKENGKTYMYVNHFSGGSGTQSDPYFVSTPTDLDNVRNNLSAYYKMNQDIDMSGWGNFTPIGNSTNRFTGTLDGDGYKVFNLTVNLTENYAGLFGFINYPVDIGNLKVEGDVTTSAVIAGLLAGSYYGSASFIDGRISNCATSGSVTAKSHMAGLIGYTREGAQITNCYSDADIYATSESTETSPIGGLVGYLGTSSSSDSVYTTLTESYFNGTITPLASTRVGSIAGYLNLPHIDNCYWNTDKYPDGYGDSQNGTTPVYTDEKYNFTGLTDSQMKDKDNFLGFNFDFGWEMSLYTQYPIQVILSTTTELLKYDYTGSSQQFVAPKTGVYKLGLYGAEGGRYGSGSITGKGGYAYGEVELQEGEVIYIYVGEQGNTVQNTAYNGGGQSGQYAGSGGGGTDIRYAGTGVDNRIIVAGGGGGATATTSGSKYHGGDGGGLNGQDGYGDGNNAGLGGTQTSGGQYNGTLHSGGNQTTDYACGGGGGYYGGGAAKYGYYDSGGGGSSYLGGVTNGKTETGTNSGAGYSLISYKLVNLGSSTLSANENIIAYNTETIYDITTDFDKGTYNLTKVVEGKLTLTQGGA